MTRVELKNLKAGDCIKDGAFAGTVTNVTPALVVILWEGGDPETLSFRINADRLDAMELVQ